MDVANKTKVAAVRPHVEIAHALKNAVQSVKTVPKGVYGITSAEFGRSHHESARIFIEAGIRLIQYREKKNPNLDEAIKIRELCHVHGAIFIVNDSLEVAVQSGADGLHLGQSDMPIEDARKQFRGIIGLSVTSLEQALDARERGATYLGVGAVFPSSTKLDYPHMSGDEFRSIRQAVAMPLYAIGGITVNNVSTIKALGADGIAVMSAVLAAKDPVAAGMEIVKKWNGEDAKLHHHMRE